MEDEHRRIRAETESKIAKVEEENSRMAAELGERE